MTLFRLVSAGLGGVLLAGQSVCAAEVKPAMTVLITNDDGIEAEGIRALVEALTPVATVVVSAPAENNSGAGQSITALGRPLRVVERDLGDGVKRFAVYGTPADATIFGLLGTGGEKPFDLVISGINKGQNVGEAVFISGTVGAARQAVMMGVPAIAVSQAYQMDGKYDYSLAAKFTAKLASEIHRLGRKAPILLSVNVPGSPKGVKLVPASGKAFELKGIAPIGPNEAGGTNYRVILDLASGGAPDTDAGALADGFITVSLLGMNGNAEDRIEQYVSPEILSLSKAE